MFQKIRWGNRRGSMFYAWAEADLWLLGSCILLTVFGGVMIRSVELQQGLTDWWQHWITGAVGLTLALIISRCRYERLIQWRWVIYGIINLSLIAVQIIGTTALGAQRWINIGGFHVQPSEFAKVGIIITLAALLQELKTPNFRDLIRILAIA
ncbi:MAG TPA: FtsW/RodA/SpoVE family cell cycle protein, partial [Candidatus Obscuribacterales bacterium]